MFIAVPHQGPPHVGRPCITGEHNCEADCQGCRDYSDGHRIIGGWDTGEPELIAAALDYQGHQAAKVHSLAHGLNGDTFCDDCGEWHEGPCPIAAD